MNNKPLTSPLTTLASCLAALLPAAASGAQGPYVELGAGVNLVRDHNVWRNGQPIGIVDYDKGGLGTLALGYHLPQGYRADLELGFRRNVADATGAAVAGHGSVNAQSLMANLWFDWPLTPLKPFAGAGIGAVMLDARHFAGAGSGDRTDEDTVLAYQMALGLAYDVAPHLALSLGYRWMDTDDGSFEPGPVDMDYRADAWLATVRYSFGRAGSTMAAATPVPEAEVAAFETIVLRPVNFRFDEATLTEPAQRTLDEIARSLQEQPGVRVTIEGHTDSIGTDRYNMDLGLRRAVAVRDYLAGKGVDSDTLDVRSMGEGQPVADNGSAEGRAANRRAEFDAGPAPANVRIVIEAPTEASKDAAQGR